MYMNRNAARGMMLCAAGGGAVMGHVGCALLCGRCVGRGGSLTVFSEFERGEWPRGLRLLAVVVVSTVSVAGLQTQEEGTRPHGLSRSGRFLLLCWQDFCCCADWVITVGCGAAA
jgi:hypothetical protein